MYQRPLNRYLTEFLALDCAPDIMAMKLFPNAKEITESVGAFNAVRNHIVNNDCSLYKNPRITVVSVGDGSTPRTAALFAYRTAWNCISIDPNMRDKSRWSEIKRLTIHRSKIEDLTLNFPHSDMAIILMVHSHATISDTLAAIHGSTRHLITIPCCVPHEIPGRPYIGYVDREIATEKNTVKIWKNI